MNFNTILEVRVLQDLMEESGGHVIKFAGCVRRLIVKTVWRVIRSFQKDESPDTEPLLIPDEPIIASHDG